MIGLQSTGRTEGVCGVAEMTKKSCSDSKTLQVQEHEHSAVLKEIQGESELVWLGNGDSQNDQGWKLLT